MNNSVYQHRNTRSKIPIEVKLIDFKKFIDPFLSKGARGPKPKIHRRKIFNYILYVLYTGIQWNQLKTNRNEIHWTNIYKWHNRWSKDGSYQNLFETSIIFLRDNNKLDLSILHADGSNTIAKKGEKALVIPAINIKKD